jgi:hypothetical protein
MILARRASEGGWPRPAPDAQPIPSLARRASMGRVQLIGKPLYDAADLELTIRRRRVVLVTGDRRKRPITRSEPKDRIYGNSTSSVQT